MASACRRNIAQAFKCVAATGIIASFHYKSTQQFTPFSAVNNKTKFSFKLLQPTYCDDRFGIEVPRPAGFQKQEDFAELWKFTAHFEKSCDLASMNVTVILTEADRFPFEYPAFGVAAAKFQNLNMFTKYYRQAKGFVGLNIDILKIGAGVQPHYDNVTKPFQALSDDQKLTIINSGILTGGSMNSEKLEEIIEQLDGLMAVTVIELIKAEIKHISACFGNKQVEAELLRIAEDLFEFEAFLEDQEGEEEEDELDEEAENDEGNENFERKFAEQHHEEGKDHE